MLFAKKPVNYDELRTFLTKAERRKGKPATLAGLQDGDLVRMGHSLDIVCLEKRDGREWISFAPYLEELWPRLVSLRGCGLREGARLEEGTELRLVAPSGSYPRAQKRPPITTILTDNQDGTYCGQNVLAGMVGQHFRVTAAQAEDLRQDPMREVEEGQGPCGCDVQVGQCREYDGHVWTAPTVPAPEGGGA